MPAPRVDSNVVIIDDVKTEIQISRFNPRPFILITQLKKIGTIVEAKKEPSFFRGEDLDFDQEPLEEQTRENQANYDLQVLLGKREDMRINLLARMLIERLFPEQTEARLLLSIGLQKSVDISSMVKIAGSVVELFRQTEEA